MISDVDRGDLLNLIRHNVDLNKSVAKHPVEVMELDFQQPTLKREVLEKLLNIRVVIAADGEFDKSRFNKLIYFLYCSYIR